MSGISRHGGGEVFVIQYVASGDARHCTDLQLTFKHVQDTGIREEKISPDHGGHIRPRRCTAQHTRHELITVTDPLTRPDVHGSSNEERGQGTIRGLTVATPRHPENCPVPVLSDSSPSDKTQCDAG